MLKNWHLLPLYLYSFLLEYCNISVLFSSLLSFFKTDVLNSSPDNPTMLIIITEFLAPASTVRGVHGFQKPLSPCWYMT